MNCFSSLLLLVTSVAAPRTDSVPAALVLRVRAEIAARWKVDTAAVQLEWGQWIGDSSASAAPFRLTGGVNDGWFAVTVLPYGAPARAVRVHAGTRRDVPTASKPLNIGHTLDASDIAMANQIAWGAPVANVEQQIVGWEVRRPLHEGDPLAGPMIAPPIVISTGDAVVLTWSQGGVHVERDGVAMQPARLGDPVRVRAGVLQIAGLAIAPDTARVVRRP